MVVSCYNGINDTVTNTINTTQYTTQIQYNSQDRMTLPSQEEINGEIISTYENSTQTIFKMKKTNKQKASKQTKSR